jgi:hypothetical protein
MAATLTGLGFTVDKVVNGSLEQMESAVLQLKKRLSASRNAYGFLFYAGHGVQSGGENYLIPVNANIQTENSLRRQAIAVQEMLDELNDARNELNIVVLDACRDNPFPWKRSGSRGLQVVGNQPSDSIIVFATSAGSTAADGEGKNGLFTSHLLSNLKKPGLEVTEVFRLTMGDVASSSGNQQRPAIYNQFAGLAYLGSRPAPAPVAQPAPAPAAQPAPEPVAPPIPTLVAQPTPVPAPQPAPVVQPATTPAAQPAPASIFRDNKYVILANAEWRPEVFGANSNLVKNTSARFNVSMVNIEGKEREVLRMEVNLANGKGNEFRLGQFTTYNKEILQRLKRGSGIRFKALGDGKNWKILFPTKETESDHCEYEMTITAKQGIVTEFNIPYSGLKQPSWGKKVAFNKSNILNLNIQRNSETKSGNTEYGTSMLRIFDLEIY